MKNINIKKSQFQAFPYHLVDPSPWPILVSFSIFSMAIGAVMYMHGFSNGGLLLNLGFILTVYGMILWFRDVIVEGTNININISNFIKINFNQLIYFIKMLINTFF
jgi:cytochrome c oxidase subunit 3